LASMMAKSLIFLSLYAELLPTRVFSQLIILSHLREVFETQAE
jgi:hypothetical protein